MDEYYIYKMKKALMKFVGICDKLNIQYCLTHGTCLTMYRDGELTRDVDVGVFADKEKIKQLFNTLEKANFRKGDCSLNPGGEINQHFWSENNALLDVFVQFLEDEKEFFQNFKRLKVWDNLFNIPDSIEEYLELNYGDWKTKREGKSRPPASERIDGDLKKSILFDINLFLECEGRWKNY